MVRSQRRARTTGRRNTTRAEYRRVRHVTFEIEYIHVKIHAVRAPCHAYGLELHNVSARQSVCTANWSQRGKASVGSGRCRDQLKIRCRRNRQVVAAALVTPEEKHGEGPNRRRGASVRAARRACRRAVEDRQRRPKGVAQRPAAWRV